MKALKFIDWRLLVPTGVAFIIVALSAFAPALLGVVLGAGFSNALVNISFSMIAAFVFYLVVDVARRKREATAIAPLVSAQIRQLKGSVLSVCREAARIVGTPLSADWQFNRDDVDPIFKKVGLFADAAMVDPAGQRQSFLSFLIYHAQRSDSFLENLVQISPFLGAEAATYIAKIQLDGYLMQMKMLLPIYQNLRKDSKADFIGNDIAKHYDAILKLEDWACRNGVL